MTDRRFVSIHREGTLTKAYEILIDRITGVNYVFATHSNAGGITPLLDNYGRVVVSSLPIDEKQD